ncbi:MAG: SDR family NAD(P)-dependent oxidoreductase [Burkholderiaceae bacterium]
MADKKKILITGAGSGFGLGAAIKLQSMGHQVVGGVVDAAQADALHEHGIRSLQLDVTDPVDIAAVDALELDVLVNNAGRGQLGALADIDMANVRKVFEVNVFGTLQVTQAAIPAMKRKKSGRIIIVSSIAGVFSGQLTGPYAMTKHALEAMSKSLRAELEPYGISVAKLNPGPYATGFNDQMVEAVEAVVAPGSNEAEMASGTRKRMLGNQLDPQEVVDAMVSLCVEPAVEFETFKPDNILERYGARIVRPA